MDIEAFRNGQGPIRDRYKADADAALLTLKARGTPDASTVTCKVETGRGLAVAGIHQKVGGSGRELCSGDMLLEALVACAGVSMRAAAAVLEIPIKSATVSAEGDVDLRGTLGVAEDVPVGFREIRLSFDVETDAPQKDVDRLLELTDRYCVVFQTLQNSPKALTQMNVIRPRGARAGKAKS
ncbi:MAG TPA: OsmC family protein [Pseudolabrys sp.]|nr:OsmC family protein [Pseudolabrys sp.]